MKTKTADEQAASPEAEPTEAAPETSIATLAADPATEKSAGIVQAWIFGHIHGGPIGRNTECWNALYAALPALVLMIQGD